jgi:hypothetical protein
MDHGQPIDEAVQHLALTETERAAVCALPGVRTVGDLVIVLERGEVGDTKLVAKLKKVLG